MRIVGVVVASVLVGLTGAAQAEMKDWQLRRFLNFRSQCQMDDFVDRSAPTGPGKFHAICRNTTFYPDGVDLDWSRPRGRVHLQDPDAAARLQGSARASRRAGQVGPAGFPLDP